MQQARHSGARVTISGRRFAEFADQALLRAVALDEDRFEDGFRHRPDVDLRIQLAAHALDVEQGLLQQDQLRLQRELVALGGAEQLDQHLGQRDPARQVKYGSQTARAPPLPVRRCGYAPASSRPARCSSAMRR